MNKLQQDVIKFHEKLKRPIGVYPKVISKKDQGLRQSLIAEEFLEVTQAMADEDLVAIADGICDLIYILVGTAIEYGIDLEPIWHDVHRTNMLKEGGATRADGKIIKPAGWLPPDVSTLLKLQIESGTPLKSLILDR